MEKNKINYVVGNLFDHIPADEVVVIPHIVNNVSAWGAGFVVPLAKRFPLARDRYMKWALEKYDVERGLLYVLGSTQMVVVEKNIIVANMVSQNGLISADNPKPIRYSALVSCMASVAHTATMLKAKIIAPAFGTGFAKGNPQFIEDLINEIWIDSGISVTIYNL